MVEGERLSKPLLQPGRQHQKLKKLRNPKGSLRKATMETYVVILESSTKRKVVEKALLASFGCKCVDEDFTYHATD
jgi:hypothetical protein